MAGKLTEAQVRALNNINDYPYKSGRFHASDGIEPTTISRLCYLGFIQPSGAHIGMRSAIFGRSWFITPAGRAALEREKRG